MATARTRSKAPDDKRYYSRTSNDIWRNKKILATGLPVTVAVGAHTCVIAWCSDEETDGVFNLRALMRLTDIDQPTADAMVKVGLWHLPGHTCPRCPDVEPGDAIVHDYLRHQRSAEDTAALSAKRSDAGSRGANARYNGQPPPPPPGKLLPSMASAMASAMANGQQPHGNVLADIDIELNPPLPPLGDQLPATGAHPEEETKPKLETEADGLAALIAEIATIRPDWTEQAIAIAAGTAYVDRRRNLPLVAAAFRIIAPLDYGSEHPNRITGDGPWWPAAARALKAAAARDAQDARRAALTAEGPYRRLPAPTGSEPVPPADPTAPDYRHQFTACTVPLRGQVVCAHPGCGDPESSPRHRPALHLVTEVA